MRSDDGVAVDTSTKDISSPRALFLSRTGAEEKAGLFSFVKKKHQ